MKHPIQAVYREREDGDWDFIAAFAADEMADNWPQQLVEYFTANGDSAKVVGLDDLAHLTDVLIASTAGEPT